MGSPVVIVLIGTVVAGFVQGLSGFAFSLVAMSFWVWSVEPRLAAALAVFGSLTGQLGAAFTVRRGFDFKILAPFLAGGLLGIPLGVAVLPRVDDHLLKLLLGALLAIWCPLMLVIRRMPAVTFGGRAADGAIGLIGGTLGGIGGFAGAVPTLWCNLRGMEKDTQRAVIQNFNLTMQAVTMALYIKAGIVTSDMLPLFVMVVPATLIPMLFGAKLYVGVSEEAFRTIILMLLAASGVVLIASSFVPTTGRAWR